MSQTPRPRESGKAGYTLYNQNEVRRLGLLAMDRPRTQEKNESRYDNSICEFHDDGEAKLLLAALLCVTNGTSIKPGHMIQMPSQIAQGRRNVS